MSAPTLKGSLTRAPGYVDDALQLASLTPFVPENVVIGEYTFLPWVRTGLASALEPPAGDTVRAVVHLSVTVQDDNGVRVEVPPKTLTLRGPGDVIGLDSSQIIRRFPMPGARDAEEVCSPTLSSIGPSCPGFSHRCRSRLTINFRLGSRSWCATPSSPRSRRVRPVFHPSSTPFLANCSRSTIPGPGGMRRLSDQPEINKAKSTGSRCNTDPRIFRACFARASLPEGRSYLACLVPAFDCGVKAASGLGGGSLGPAWKRAPNDAGNQIVLPVFDSWSFFVAPAGDFELLAGRLHGLPAPWNVGRRFVDTSHPRGGLPKLPAGAPGEITGVALRARFADPGAA